MEINLLSKHTDDIQFHRTAHEENLIKDLKMELLLGYMSDNVAYLYEICKEVLIVPLTKQEDILWRQEVIKEAIKYPELFEKAYNIATATLEEIEGYREFTAPKYYQIIKNSKKIITEVEMLEIIINRLEELCSLLEKDDFNPERGPFLQFKKRLVERYNKAFFETVRAYIEELKLIKEHQQMTVTGHLFLGFKRADWMLNSLGIKETQENTFEVQRFWSRFLTTKESNNMYISLEETSTENNVRELVEANLEAVFKVLSRFNKELIHFFRGIRYQFGVYSCCSHLYSALTSAGVSCCFPEFVEDENSFSVKGLIDIGLVIKNGEMVIGNTVSVKNKNLWLITGANQGGKTTFLRSIGLGVLMAQSGLFVSATFYKAKIFTGIFTHFPSEEDEHVNKGLLEMELERLAQIIKYIQPNGLLLMNESFATTTEKEGAHIAEEVTRAFRECDIMTVFVTHLFEYADTLYKTQPSDVSFYRARRKTDGMRTYEIKEGKPLDSNNGMDLYVSSIEREF